MLSPWALFAICFCVGVIGAVVGGRWRFVGRTLLAFLGALSLASLLTVSMHSSFALPRAIILVITVVLALFAVHVIGLPSISPAMATKALVVLSAAAGAWLFACSIDLWIGVGLIDALGMFVVDPGVFAKGADVVVQAADQMVAQWDDGRFKGLLAGAWLVWVVSTVFQFWRYRAIGEDTDEVRTRAARPS